MKCATLQVLFALSEFFISGNLKDNLPATFESAHERANRMSQISAWKHMQLVASIARNGTDALPAAGVYRGCRLANIQPSFLYQLCLESPDEVLSI